ncbi:MAG: hypothetical protein LBS81_03635 [Endomicrobium sp.]|jgi:dipeptidase|nr:hypothetical protein [Endomicrobium sp.]
MGSAACVPDGEYFIAANEFRIRDVIPGNPDQMYEKTLFEVIERNKMRSPQIKAKAYGLAYDCKQRRIQSSLLFAAQSLEMSVISCAVS